MRKQRLNNVFKSVFLVFLLYIFLLSIKLISTAFKMFGKDVAEQLLQTTANPVVGLFIGILATTLMQSSSSTTSILVGIVAAGGITLSGAIPIIMGANIGTTVTNTLVSMGHITRKGEFKKAFAAATVHDFFNIIIVLILFPIELLFHPLEKTALLLTSTFSSTGGAELSSPLSTILHPTVEFIKTTIDSPVAIIILALALMFFALRYIVKTIKSLVIEKIENFLHSYLFKTPVNAYVIGIFFTVLVQSSSVTTSLVVPLVGTGLLTVEKIFPYTLGANVGTTITAILAALATGKVVAITVAFAHLIFNIVGSILIWPIRHIPVNMSHTISEFITKKRGLAILYIIVVFYVIPAFVIYILR